VDNKPHVELEPLMHYSNSNMNYNDETNSTGRANSTLVESLISNTSVERPNKTKTQRNVVIALAVSLISGLVSGTLYGFGRYSRDLKDTLMLTQYQIERFGILLDTGNYIGHPITGLVYDRLGPRISCLSAAVIVFCAYGMIQLGVIRHITAHWIFDTSFFFVGLGSGLGYIAALGSTTKNFQSSRHFSLAIGIVASGYGLSSTIVGLSYHAVGLNRFFLLWAVLVAFGNLLGSCYLVVPNEDEEKTNEEEMDEEGANDSLQNNANEEVPSEAHRSEQIFAAEWNDWREKDFWLLFFAFAGCTGCGLFIINNISTMVQSIQGNDSFAAKLVVLLSLSNFSGRLLMGFLADLPRVSKMVMLASTALVMAAALFLSAMAQPDSASVCLIITVALIAAAYGGTWVLVVGILSDFFGNHNFGKNYGLIAMGPALSGMLFNTFSAWTYEKYTPIDSEVCLGKNCYYMSFLLTGSAAILSCMVSSLLECSRRQSSVLGNT